MIVIHLQKIGSMGIKLHFLAVDETIRGKGFLWKYKCKNIPDHNISIISQSFPDINSDNIYLYGNDKFDDNTKPCVNVYANIRRDILYDEYVNALKEYSKYSGIPIAVSEFKNLKRM